MARRKRARRSKASYRKAALKGWRTRRRQRTGRRKKSTRRRRKKCTSRSRRPYPKPFKSPSGTATRAHRKSRRIEIRSRATGDVKKVIKRVPRPNHKKNCLVVKYKNRNHILRMPARSNKLFIYA